MSEYCAIFCRVSTEQQAKEGLSLDAQQIFLERYAKCYFSHYNNP
jgi:DNA invertase Pin-like site-specific DNA recombinase